MLQLNFIIQDSDGSEQSIYLPPLSQFRSNHMLHNASKLYLFIAYQSHRLYEDAGITFLKIGKQIFMVQFSSPLYVPIKYDIPRSFSTIVTLNALLLRNQRPNGYILHKNLRGKKISSSPNQKPGVLLSFESIISFLGEKKLRTMKQLLNNTSNCCK